MAEIFSEFSLPPKYNSADFFSEVDVSSMRPLSDGATFCSSMRPHSEDSFRCSMAGMLSLF